MQRLSRKAIDGRPQRCAAETGNDHAERLKFLNEKMLFWLFFGEKDQRYMLSFKRFLCGDSPSIPYRAPEGISPILCPQDNLALARGPFLLKPGDKIPQRCGRS